MIINYYDENEIISFVKHRNLNALSRYQQLEYNILIHNQFLNLEDKINNLLDFSIVHRFHDLFSLLTKDIKNDTLDEKLIKNMIVLISKYGTVQQFFFIEKINKSVLKKMNWNTLFENALCDLNIPILNYILEIDDIDLWEEPVESKRYVPINYKNLFTNTIFYNKIHTFFRYLHSNNNTYIKKFIKKLKISIQRYIDLNYYHYETKEVLCSLSVKFGHDKKIINFILDLSIKHNSNQEFTLIDDIIQYLFENKKCFDKIFNIFEYKLSLLKTKDEEFIFNSLTKTILHLTCYSKYLFDSDILNSYLNHNYKYFNLIKKILKECKLILNDTKMKEIISYIDIHNLVSKKNSLALIKFLYSEDNTIFNIYDDSHFSPLLDVTRYGDYNTFLFVLQKSDPKYMLFNNHYEFENNHIIYYSFHNNDTRILKHIVKNKNIIDYFKDFYKDKFEITISRCLEFLKLTKYKNKNLIFYLNCLNQIIPLNEIVNITSYLLYLRPIHFKFVIEKFSISLEFNYEVENEYNTLGYEGPFCKNFYLKQGEHIQYIIDNLVKYKKIDSVEYLLLNHFKTSCVKDINFNTFIKIINQANSNKLDYIDYFYNYVTQHIRYLCDKKLIYKKNKLHCRHCGNIENCLNNNLNFFKDKIDNCKCIEKIIKKQNCFSFFTKLYYELFLKNEKVMDIVFKNGFFNIIRTIIIQGFKYYKFDGILKLNINKLLSEPVYQKYSRIYLFFSIQFRKKINKYKFKHKTILSGCLYKISYKNEINLLKNKFSFNKNTPVHVTAKSLLTILKSKEFFITEKADGVRSKINLVHYYPYIDCYKDNSFNKFYSEEIIVNNKKINLVYTDYETNRELRKLHPYINNNYNNIFTIYDNNYVSGEKNELYTFIDKNRNKNNLWWPKLIWKIDYNILLNNYENIKNLEYNIFNTDGWIIFDNEKSVKLKPDKHLTIDLYYKNNFFYSKENIVISNVEKKNELKYKNEKIYRCYYKEKEKCWKAEEYRYDKKFANDFYIIEQINNYFNYKWDTKLDILNVFMNSLNYYQIYDKKLNMFKNSNIDTYHIVKKFGNMNSNTLDICCGFKSIKYRTLLNSKIYIGLDKDLQLIDFYKDKNINFKVMDISEDWDKQIRFFNYNSLLKCLFNTILILNSIQNCYQNKDNFINSVSKIANKGCICIVTFLDFSKLNSILSKNNSNYIKKKCNYVKLIENQKIKYYYSHCHSEPVTEYVFSKKEIEELFMSKQWKLIYCHEKNINTLDVWTNYKNSFSTLVFRYK